MKIVRDRPPMFDEIDAKFNVRGKPIMFAWGPTLFIPSGSLDVPRHLMAHEQVHSSRQGRDTPGITLWWRSYLDDAQFRLHEEILAHQAEYHELLRHGGGRNDRRRHLAITASRLAAPLYGRMISVKDAKAALVDGHTESL